MSPFNPHLNPDDPDESIGRDPQAIISDIQQSGHQLMAAIQELIEWTDYDISQLGDYLNRIENFLHEVSAAHPKTYTLAQLTQTLKIDEPALRTLLSDVGVPIDPDTLDPAETVSEADLIPLLADRAGSRIGDCLADLLRGEGPYISRV
jgi:hypothetical protein